MLCDDSYYSQSLSGKFQGSFIGRSKTKLIQLLVQETASCSDIGLAILGMTISYLS